MIVDTSAILAILLGEDDAAEFAIAVERAEHCAMSAVNYLEAGIVLDRRLSASTTGTICDDPLAAVIEAAEISIEAVTVEHADVARAAYRKFGKGNHPAGLNFGDCFAYALAKLSGEPLLFKGNDFALTDLVPAR